MLRGGPAGGGLRGVAVASPAARESRRARTADASKWGGMSESSERVAFRRSNAAHRGLGGMVGSVAPPPTDREHTDESLRRERAASDRVVNDSLAVLDATADAVIALARARADQVLACARAEADATPSRPRESATVRMAQDDAIREERALADATVRRSRAEQLAHVSTERVGTDTGLSGERAQADIAVAARDEVLAVVSHDLRNMLNGIMGFASLVEDSARGRSDDETTLHAQRIQRTGARLGRLVGDLVDVAGIQAGKLAVTPALGDAAEVLVEAVDAFQLQASARRVSLLAEVPASLPLVEIDAARLLQVLANLLDNALKFTPPEGKIVVRLERIGEELQFGVRDTGEGIPRGELDAVFLRFHQVATHDRRGVGLGLYISRCIVQGHGGRIWAESEVGAGSTFCFTLPMLVAPRAS